MRTLLLPALLLAALPAFAAAPLTFEEVDTDGDGLISADEAASVEGLDFNAADGDNDGTLSVDEYDIALENLSPPEEETSPTDADAAQPAEATTPASPSADAANAVPPTAPAASSTKADNAKPTTSVKPKPATPPASSKP